VGNRSRHNFAHIFRCHYGCKASSMRRMIALGLRVGVDRSPRRTWDSALVLECRVTAVFVPTLGASIPSTPCQVGAVS